MSRKARLSRNLPVDIDTKALLNIARQAGATHKQFMTAYSRALKRTAVTLRKRAMSDLKTGLAPRNLSTVRRRILTFRLSRTTEPDIFRLWFGLNTIRVSDLKGRIRGRIRPRHTRRDKKTGRFICARRQAENPGFDPAGSLLKPLSFEHGEVARAGRDHRRTVVILDQTFRRLRPAEVDISEPVLNYIEDHAFAEAMEIFMHHFTADIKGRVKAGISV